MLPIKLCWAWTVHICQGMTIGSKIVSVVSELTNKEQTDGATYVTMSRVKRFADVGIKDGIDKIRSCYNKIRKHKQMKKRILEERRLEKSCE